MRSTLLARVLLWLLALAAFTACAADPHHTFWLAKGNRNTVYLLGSVHVLRPADSQLPPVVLDAYARAKGLVMELDLDQAAADGMLAALMESATLPAGQTLQGALGGAVYEQFSAHAKPLGLDAAMMSRFQPWFAAMTLTQLELAKLGFVPDSGIDVQLARRAKADGKRVVGLETVEEQFRFFARMPLDQQRNYVVYLLTETDRAAQSLDALVLAWRNGDAQGLEALAGAELRAFPDLTRALLIERNRNWLPIIARLLESDDDYLVVVGALHLVGPDGIVALLRKQGREVVQQ